MASSSKKRKASVSDLKDMLSSKCDTLTSKMQRELEQLYTTAQNLRQAREEESTFIENERSEWLIKCDEEKETAKAQVRDERQSFQLEKTAWEAEKVRVARSGTFGQKIKLDVGGSKFTTTMTTLQRFPESMLGAMFSGRHALPLDEDGCYFIDRDGTHFKYILNFLRDPEYFSMKEVTDTIAAVELEKEAAYYGLQDLMIPFTPISQIINNDIGSLGNCGFKMELTQQSRNGQWSGAGARIGLPLQPVQWCRHCYVGYIVYSNGADWCGISAFAKNRSIPDNQPAPTATCLHCKRASA